MAKVTPQGIEPTTLQGYRDALGESFRRALGVGLDLDPDTPQGQLIGVLAETLAEEDEALVAVANGFSRDRALGIQLDDLGSLLGVSRLHGIRSTVSVTLTGRVGTTIRAGSRVKTAAAGDVFALDADVTIPAGGSAEGAMTSQEAGPVPAATGTLTAIVDVVAGWEAATNAATATLGRALESDDAYRARFGALTARNARGSSDAILAAVLDVEGMVDAIIRANDTDAAVTLQGQSIGAHSVFLVVDGGADGDVAAAIARAKSAGTGTSGDVSVDVPHPSGWTVATRFKRVIDIALTVTIETTFETGFPSDGTGRIIAGVVKWFQGARIGQPIDTNRLLTPITAVPGHTISTVTVARKEASGTGVTISGDIGLADRLTIAAGDITITTS